MGLLLDWLLQPVGIIFTLLFLALWWVFFTRGIPLAPKLLLLCAVTVFWISGAPLTANALVKTMEYAPDTDMELCNGGPSSSQSVVVLGADLDAYVASSNPYRVLGQESLRRTFHAASLDTGSNRFYVSGGGRTSRKLSDFMAQVLKDQGIEEHRIIREPTSQSTLENAQALAMLMGGAESVPISLVTSALHMSRAMEVFQRQGFEVCPSGSGTLYSVSKGWVGLLPYISSLSKTTQVLREWLSVRAYRFRLATR